MDLTPLRCSACGNVVGNAQVRVLNQGRDITVAEAEHYEAHHRPGCPVAEALRSNVLSGLSIEGGSPETMAECRRCGATYPVKDGQCTYCGVIRYARRMEIFFKVTLVAILAVIAILWMIYAVAG